MSNPNNAPDASVRTVLSEEERRMRQLVFAHRTRTVLVKTYACGPFEELPLRERNTEAVEAEQKDENQRMGRDSHAYRADRPDNGFALFQKEQLVSLVAILDDLLDAGYVLSTESHRYVDKDVFDGGRRVRKGKGDVNVFSFDLPREGVVERILTRPMREFLERTFNNVSLWCNLKNPVGKPSFRLDTVNAAKHASEAVRKVLRRHGNSYRLIKPAAATDAFVDLAANIAANTPTAK